MKNVMPSWPQTLSICAAGAVFCLLGYKLSRLHGSWGTTEWTITALLVLSGLAFIATLFTFYLRPQYGKKAFPALLFLLVGHAALVAILIRTQLVK
jgi:hypothetical protein